MIETRRFPPLLVAVALVILLHQTADLATLLPAADFGTPAGRVAQLLAALQRTPALVIADVLLSWALLAAGRANALRLLAGLHLGGGVLLLVLLPWFLLDAGTLAGGFAGSEALGFRILAARTLLLLLLAGSGAILAGRMLVSAAREAQG